MNKQELISAMAEKTGMTKKDSQLALEAFQDVVVETLTKKEKIQLVGFGTYETAIQKPREVGNPKDPSQGKWMTEEKVVPKFKFGKPVKDKIAEVK